MSSRIPTAPTIDEQSSDKWSTPLPVAPARIAAPVEYEPRLIEEAVRESIASGAVALPPALQLRLQMTHRRALDQTYAIEPVAEREAAFRRHFRRMFEELGLEDAVVAGLSELADWPWRLEGVLVQAADSPQQEGAQLWESRARRGSGAPAYLVVHVVPSRFSAPPGLIAYLRDELRSAADSVETARPGGEVSSSRRCPLCSFPTIVWASKELLEDAAAAIEADYPDWSRAVGCCEHCADRYGDGRAAAFGNAP